MSTGTPEQVLKSIVDGINTGNLDALMTLPKIGWCAEHYARRELMLTFQYFDARAGVRPPMCAVVTPRHGDTHHVVADHRFDRRLELNCLQHERVVFVVVAQSLQHGQHVSVALLPSVIWLILAMLASVVLLFRARRAP